MKLNTMKIKIAFWTGICLILTSALIISYSAISMKRRAEIARKTAVENAEKYAEAIAKEQANHIKAELEVSLDTARTLAHTFSGIKDKSLELELGREEVNGILRTVLAQNPGFLGIWTLWEPDAFDGMDMGYINDKGHDKSGRFIPYWNRGGENGAIVLEAIHDYENADWYNIPKKTKQESILEPFVYSVQGKPVLMTSLVAPVTVGDVFYGAVGIDIRLNVFQEMADDVRDMFQGTARMEIISNMGIFLAVTGQPQLSGKHIREYHEDWEEDLEYIRRGKTVNENDEGRLGIFVPIQIGYTTTPWCVSILIPMEKATAAADEQMLQAEKDILHMIIIGILCTLSALFLIVMIARKIAQPLGAEPFVLSEIAQKIAMGDLDIGFSENRESEGVYRNMWQMTENLRKKAEMAEAVAQGDLTGEIRPDSEKDVLGKALEQMAENLRDMIGKISDTASYLAESSGNIADSSQVLSEGANEQAASLEEISSSMIQVTSQIRYTAENAAHASRFAEDAKQTAENGRQEMQELISAMGEISESSRAVAKVIKVIDEIAFQTNLLSLNAAVEAARAGRHGKGFAVVAGEVRNLAGRSAHAAKETAELIESALDKVKKGNGMAVQTAQALEKITASAVKTSDLITEIAAASEEQARGSEQVRQGLDQVDQVTQNNAANAQETASSAMQLAVQAERLRKVTGRFRRKEEPREFSDMNELPEPECGKVRQMSPSEKNDWKQRGKEMNPQMLKEEAIILPEEIIPFDEDFS